MSNKELELEARKHKVEEYANADGTISRERIISQLVARDAAQQVPQAVLRSWLALGVSAGSLLLSIYTLFR